MDQKNLEALLIGKDLRSLGNSSQVIHLIKTQEDFDQLFNLISHQNRIIAMRAADIIDKISLTKPFYLTPHKETILGLLQKNLQKEIAWHIALLLPKMKLSNKELKWVWNTLSSWLLNKKNSRIVRVNALQSLFELSNRDLHLKSTLLEITKEIENENTPSLIARIRKLKL